MAKKTCDHLSAGQIIRRGDEILLIERMNYPQAIALPAGHLDGNGYLLTAVKETKEEVGIDILESRLVLQGHYINNPCKRDNGTHHSWAVYDSNQWLGIPKAASDAKKILWADSSDLKNLADRTEFFFEKYKLEPDQINELTKKIFGKPSNPKTDKEWEKSPGLEPVWYHILKELKII